MSEENNSLRRRGEGADLEPRLVRIFSPFCVYYGHKLLAGSVGGRRYELDGAQNCIMLRLAQETGIHGILWLGV